MALKGKFIRREGTQAIFGSKNKPEWKPMDIAGSVYADGLTQGRYYEIAVEGNRLVGYKELPEKSDYRPENQGRAYASSGRPRQDPAVIPKSSLMASATGLTKSLVEHGVPVEEAMKRGIDWARMWDPDGAPGPGFKREEIQSAPDPVSMSPPHPVAGPQPWDTPPPADEPPPWVDE